MFRIDPKEAARKVAFLDKARRVSLVLDDLKKLQSEMTNSPPNNDRDAASKNKELIQEMSDIVNGLDTVKTSLDKNEMPQPYVVRDIFVSNVLVKEILNPASPGAPSKMPNPFADKLKKSIDTFSKIPGFENPLDEPKKGGQLAEHVAATFDLMKAHNPKLFSVELPNNSELPKRRRLRAEARAAKRIGLKENEQKFVTAVGGAESAVELLSEKKEILDFNNLTSLQEAIKQVYDTKDAAGLSPGARQDLNKLRVTVDQVVKDEEKRFGEMEKAMADIAKDTDMNASVMKTTSDKLSNAAVKPEVEKRIASLHESAANVITDKKISPEERDAFRKKVDDFQKYLNEQLTNKEVSAEDKNNLRTINARLTTIETNMGRFPELKPSSEPDKQPIGMNMGIFNVDPTDIFKPSELPANPKALAINSPTKGSRNLT